MEEREALAIMARVGAVIVDSHVVYTSGQHGSAYINKDAIYPYTTETSRLCRGVARSFEYDHIDVVIAPAIGGVILSQWVAYHLSGLTKHRVLGVYAEKIEGTGGFVIKRGYDKLVGGRRVLVVEDVLTTGGSARKVIEVVRSLGGDVVGIGVLCNRGGITTRDLGDVPKLVSLVNMPLESWDAFDCPLCAQGVPINTDVGKGREFLAHLAFR